MPCMHVKMTYSIIQFFECFLNKLTDGQHAHVLQTWKTKALLLSRFSDSFIFSTVRFSTVVFRNFFTIKYLNLTPHLKLAPVNQDVTQYNVMTLVASCILRTARIFEVAMKPGSHFVQAQCKESLDSFTACHVDKLQLACTIPKLFQLAPKNF